jgi:hypothetical protein
MIRDFLKKKEETLLILITKQDKWLIHFVIDDEVILVTKHHAMIRGKDAWR